MTDLNSYQQALDLLRQASTAHGFVAAVEERDNYKRIWTRDGVITSIAALLSGDEELIKTAGSTITTLFNRQHQTGFMPSNVSPENDGVSYGGTTGRADNPSWAVIGLCAYTILTEDQSLWETYKEEVTRCFTVMNAWEFNGKQLIYVPQSGDWADEYIQHGYVLFDQLLRVWALRLAFKVSGNSSFEKKAEQICMCIRANYWKNDNGEERDEDAHQQAQAGLYAQNLGHQLQEASSEFWLMGFNPSRIYSYFDLQANSFSLLLGLGDAVQNQQLIHFLKDMHAAKGTMLPSFYPAIENSDADMQELKNNYAYTFRNHPHFFHNGGLWAVWNGWLAAALAVNGEKEMAAAITADIHAANAQGDLFNECMEGLANIPCGVPNCTWSAAGAIIAEQALQNEAFKKLFKF